MRFSRMTPTQFRTGCEKLNISIAKSADVLGVSLRSVRAYASGKTPIPKPIAKLLRAMIRLGTIEV